MEELDDNWIKEFENQEKVYDQFYPNKVDKIKIYSLYVNKECVLDKVKEINYNLDIPNVLKKLDLLRIIKEKKQDEGINYKLISLIKYNVDLKPNEVKKYILEQSEYRFIDYLRELKDIHFYDISSSDSSFFFLIFQYRYKSGRCWKKKNQNSSTNGPRQQGTKLLLGLALHAAGARKCILMSRAM